tara:strand:- start:4200 stop:5039 length:840 start_codon:yes stop_codon:yes gene_type:complete
MDRVYIIGNGYIGNCITDNYGHAYDFVGVCRSIKNNCNKNISSDISKDNKILSNLIDKVGTVIYLAPPQNNGHLDLTLNNFLTNVDKSNITRIIYISTSGVYGDKKDKLVNEKAKLNPITSRAIRRVDAENQIQQSSINYIILRVPGIYGSNRLPLKRIEDRLPLIKPDICKHTNLIHAKDLSKIIIRCISDNNVNNIIMNVSDGKAIKTTDYYLHIYDALKIKYPEFINYEQANTIYDEKRKSFINESRKLDVTLMNTIFPNIIEFKSVIEGIKESLE